MTSPKEALENMWCSSCGIRLGNLEHKERDCHDCNDARAAIPVAELHQEAMELLIEDHNIALHGKHAQDWLARRNVLLTRWKALK